MPDANSFPGVVEKIPPSPVALFVQHFEEWVAGFLIVVLLLVVLLDVATRNFLKTSLIWPEEVSRILFIWSIFIGGGAALKAEKLITIDVLYRSLGVRGRLVLDLASFLVVAACLAILFGYGLVFFARFARDVTPTTGIPKGYFYAAVPVGSLLMFVRLVQWLRARFRRRQAAVQEILV